MSIKSLDVDALVKSGVRRPIAERAFADVNAPVHQLVAARRAEFLDNGATVRRRPARPDPRPGPLDSRRLDGRRLDRRGTRRTPRGCPADATLRNLDGLYRKGRVLATSRYVDYRTEKDFGSGRVAGDVLHESGRAIDAAYGRPSRSRSFIDVCGRDAARLPGTERPAMRYHPAPGVQGREETWAELIAQIHGRATVEHDMLDPFPTVAAWMRKLLENPRAVPRSSHAEVKP